MQTSRFAISFVAATFTMFSLEYWTEHVIHGQQHPAVARSVFDLSSIYQTIVTAGYRKPQRRSTAIVTLDPTKDLAIPDQHDLCGQRFYLSELLRAIARADPRAIVIDKWFGQRACPPVVYKGEVVSGTDFLLRTINEVSEKKPVVVGRSVDEESLELEKSLPFASDHDHFLSQGIVNVDPDTRRLPLKWRVKDDDASRDPVWRETISLKVARAVDSDNSPRLKKLVDEWKHPFISYLEEGQFGIYRSDQVLREQRDVRQAIRNKIVIIGEVDRGDRHETVIGNIPGVVLQANFIEALLDERYFEPKPFLDYVFGFLIFASFQWVLLRNHRPLWKAAAYGMVVFSIAVLMLRVVVVELGWYVNPMGVSLLALVFWYSHGLLDLLPKTADEAT